MRSQRGLPRLFAPAGLVAAVSLVPATALGARQAVGRRASGGAAGALTQPAKGVPAAPSTAPAAPAIEAVIRVIPADPNGDGPVTLDASASRDASGAIVGYRWFKGSDRAPIATSTKPLLVLPRPRSGPLLVTLQIADEHGREALTSVWLPPAPPAPRHARPAPAHPVQARAHPVQARVVRARAGASRAPAGAARVVALARHAPPAHPATVTRHRSPVLAQVAAAGTSVTIKDFIYSPGSVTVHVGDSITWLNQGPTPHTATASDHSFDTGILNKGQSGSHTFTKAGSFAYICTLHPYMKATVTVVGAASTGGGGGGGTPSGQSSPPSTGSTPTGSTSSSSTPASGAAASSGRTLPLTGDDLGRVAALGLGLLMLGLALRRTVARPDG